MVVKKNHLSAISIVHLKIVIVLVIALLSAFPSIASPSNPSAVNAESYWDSNLPVNASHLAAPHIQAPYKCAINYYVRKTGSDSNNGSLKTPWLTISHAVAVLNSQGGTHGGVCVNVGDGIYNESVNAGSLSGSSDTRTGYFVLRSSSPHDAIIQIPQGLPDYSDGIRFLNAKYIVIDGFTIIGHISTSDNRNGAGINTFGDSASACRSHHIKILNNIVHDFGGSGIASQHADYLNIEGNVVYNTCNTSVWGVSAINDYHALAYDNRNGFHIIVKDNISYNNAEVDINATHWDGNGITFDDFNCSPNSDPGYQPYVQKSLVDNNLCFGNGGAGFMTGGGGSSYVTVRNNTFFDNYLDKQNTATLRGEITVFKSHDMVVVNNICAANPTANSNNRAFVDASTGAAGNVWRCNLSFSGNPGDASTSLYESQSAITAANGNILGADPLFVNMKEGNLRLQSGSPAINAGTNAFGVPVRDLAGRVRSGKVDMGVYAFFPRTGKR
jgi:serralysin